MNIIILSIFKQTLTKGMGYELESKELTSCSQGGLAGRFGYIRRNRCEGIDKYQPHLRKDEKRDRVASMIYRPKKVFLIAGQHQGDKRYVFSR